MLIHCHACIRRCYTHLSLIDFLLFSLLSYLAALPSLTAGLLSVYLLSGHLIEERKRERERERERERDGTFHMQWREGVEKRNKSAAGWFSHAEIKKNWMQVKLSLSASLCLFHSSICLVKAESVYLIPSIKWLACTTVTAAAVVAVAVAAAAAAAADVGAGVQ